MDQHASQGVDRSLARVRAWLKNLQGPLTAFARAAGVDEKHLRLARAKADWNPTADTLRKIEAPIPDNWQPGDPMPANPSDAEAA